MSTRKPLVKFESEGQAKVVIGSMPGKRKRPSRQTKKKSRSSAGSKPRVIKGRVNVRVAGYTGVQKVPPSQLIQYLPANKVKQAAKKALLAATNKSRVKRRRTKRATKKRKG